MIIDTHAHLTAVYPCPHLNHRVVNVSVDLTTSISGLDLLYVSPHFIHAVGIHPWFVDDQSLVDLNKIFQIANDYHLSVLGEIGLDFSPRFLSNKSNQLLVFEKQLAYASRHNLSVSLHLVKSYNEMYLLLKRYPVKGVIHGFSGSVEEAKRFLGLGLKIGFNANIVHNPILKYELILSSFPMSSFVIETDYPNRPLPGHSFASLNDIFVVANKMAEFMKLDVDEVIRVTSLNAKESLQLL